MATATIGMFSGMPDPEVELSLDDVELIRAKLILLHTPLDFASNPQLGYNGVYVKMNKSEVDREGNQWGLSIYNGAVEIANNKWHSTFWKDTEGLEALIYNKVVAGNPELKSMMENKIHTNTSLFPQHFKIDAFDSSVQTNSQTKSNNKMSKNFDVRFFYVRDRREKVLQKKENGSYSRGAPIACIASRVNKEKGTIEIAFSSANLKHDTFKYALARETAIGRLMLSPIVITFDNGKLPNKGIDVLRSVIRELASNHDLPRKMKREAERWLKNAPKEVQRIERVVEESKNAISIAEKRVPRYPSVVSTKES